MSSSSSSSSGPSTRKKEPVGGGGGGGAFGATDTNANQAQYSQGGVGLAGQVKVYIA